MSLLSSIFFGMAQGIKSNGDAKLKGAEVTWLGHATFQLTSPQGKDILIDPWLENPKAPESAKDINGADVIVLTHGHFDHIGNTADLAKNSGAKVISIFEVAQYLGGQGVNEDQLIGMNISGSVEVEGMKFTMVPAIHSGGITTDNGIVPGGNPAGFIIEFENGYKVYHTGDTGFFTDLKWIGDYYNPDLLLVCIGDHFTMGPDTAAESIVLIDPEYVIPMHYGTFPLLTGTPEALKEHLPEKYRKLVLDVEPGDTVK